MYSFMSCDSLGSQSSEPCRPSNLILALTPSEPHAPSRSDLLLTMPMMAGQLLAQSGGGAAQGGGAARGAGRAGKCHTTTQPHDSREMVEGEGRWSRHTETPCPFILLQCWKRGGTPRTCLTSHPLLLPFLLPPVQVTVSVLKQARRVIAVAALESNTGLDSALKVHPRHPRVTGPCSSVSPLSSHSTHT